MRLPSGLSAGLVDTACASIATFAVGIYAARAFSDTPALLGAYELFFQAFLLAVLVPGQLIFLPTEIRALSFPIGERLGYLSASLRRGLGLAAGASAAAVGLTALLTNSTAPSTLLGLAISCLLCTWLSPVQDHLRRTFHLAEQHWRAAQVSMAQLVGAVLAVGALVIARVPASWIPFGALFIANVVSLGIGIRISRADRVRQRRPSPALAELLTTGKWLLPQGAAPFLSGYVAGVLVTKLAGAEALGYAGAARLAAQPVTVLIAGLSAVLGPKSLAAARRGDHQAAATLRRQFMLTALVAGVLYLAIAWTPWLGNPLGALVPIAYVIPHLVAVSVLANLAAAVSSPIRYELLGRGRERWLAGAEVVGSLVQVAVALAAPVLTSFARPVSEGMKQFTLAGVLLRETAGRSSALDDESPPRSRHPPTHQTPGADP